MRSSSSVPSGGKGFGFEKPIQLVFKASVEENDCVVESHAMNERTGDALEKMMEKVNRSANGEVTPSAQHQRSFSLDIPIGNFKIKDGITNLYPLKNQISQCSLGNSMDDKMLETTLEFGNSEFNVYELHKIMESDKLVEIASSDPKRVKRKRKMQYVIDLEHKFQTLQTGKTIMFDQFTKLQKDTYELKNKNNEYRLRLQALEQQSQLKDALKETLDSEVQRLRRVVAELGGESLITCMADQFPGFVFLLLHHTVTAPTQPSSPLTSSLLYPPFPALPYPDFEY
ncbi:hypothetical protein RJT34_08764 [Clitoria ternatea]|uniref:Uncharacterized protein n=1 Tax=Clitoria ternatea TaxID=43366 RepID=A0AAN9K6N0_CLITE